MPNSGCTYVSIFITIRPATFYYNLLKFKLKKTQVNIKMKTFSQQLFVFRLLYFSLKYNILLELLSIIH